MRAFEYVSPNSRAQAVSLLGTAWGNTEILAGGTDLLALMKDDVAHYVGRFGGGCQHQKKLSGTR